MTEGNPRVRLRFTKAGKIRWTSHRDVARCWERALRVVRLPLAYSAGFSPRPKVSFGLALPTGHESAAEYLDVELLDAPADLEEVATALTRALPAGLAVTAAARIERGEPSLQQEVVSCTWRWAGVPALPPIEGPAPSPAGALRVLAAPDEAVAALLARPEIVVRRTRKGRTHDEDIRASILDLRVLAGPPPGVEPLDAPAAGPLWLEADLAAQPRSIRPLEVLQALDPALDERRVCRLNQWILRDGARREPLGPLWAAPAAAVAATGAPHALERAS